MQNSSHQELNNKPPCWFTTYWLYFLPFDKKTKRKTENIKNSKGIKQFMTMTTSKKTKF